MEQQFEVVRRASHFYETKGVFVWRWNRVDGKLWRENRKGNFFGVCLIEWEGRKINGKTQVFSPRTHKKVLPKMERKLGGESSWNELPKIPLTLEFTFQVSNVLAFFFLWFFLSLLLTCWLPFFSFSFFLWIFLSLLLTCLLPFSFSFFPLIFWFFLSLLLMCWLLFFFFFFFFPLIFSGREAFFFFFFFLGAHMFIFSLILVGFCFCSFFFF